MLQKVPATLLRRAFGVKSTQAGKGFKRVGALSVKFRLATWNINSARLRMPQILRFLAEYQVDILCLQEIKCTNEQFPVEELTTLGYEHIALNGQKAYHGVAVLARLPVGTVERTVFGGIDEARHILVELPEIKREGKAVRIHNFYVPAGGDIPDADVNPKFQHKLDYLNDMARSFKKQANRREPMILVGDLNVAPLENDVWSHKQMLKVVSHTPVEVEHLERVSASLSWTDAMRCHVPEQEKLFTWWSYRARDWKASNRGRRLDHVWLTPTLEGCAKHMEVVEPARGWEKPSDHAPVIVDLEI